MTAPHGFCRKALRLTKARERSRRRRAELKALSADDPLHQQREADRRERESRIPPPRREPSPLALAAEAAGLWSAIRRPTPPWPEEVRLAIACLMGEPALAEMLDHPHRAAGMIQRVLEQARRPAP